MTPPMVSHGSTATALNSRERGQQPFSLRSRWLGVSFLALACLHLPCGASAQMVCTRLHSFGFAERSGAAPEAALVQGRDGAFYGTTSHGGRLGTGTIFKLNSDGKGYTVLHSFGDSDSDSQHPSSLIQGKDGALYGMTHSGGSENLGTVFRLNPDDMDYRVLRDFTSSQADGALPWGSLIQGSDGALYGTTSWGGSANAGTVFKVNPDGSAFTILYSFGSSEADGWLPSGSLLQGTDGALYGTTSWGGITNEGVVFRLNPDGTGYTILHDFTPAQGDGAQPSGGLIQCADGALYGTTFRGGSTNAGTVFRLNPDGTGYDVLHSFAGRYTDGADPNASLVQGSDGTLYGTTVGGGRVGQGTVYRLNPDGTGFAILRSFLAGPNDGNDPKANVVQGVDGALYGTTSMGGTMGEGTVYKLNPDGTDHAILHSFARSGGDAASPEAGLIQGADGTLYGTTFSGGCGNAGTVFRLNPDGTGYTNIHMFLGWRDDGSHPMSSLVQDSDGTLYGTTAGGGTGSWPLGTVFRLNPDGTGYTILHNFTISGTDGIAPTAPLLRDRNGVLYGTAYRGGQDNIGTAFKLNPDGTGFTNLHIFRYTGGDGRYPEASLILGSDGALYGTTTYGGSTAAGTVFKVNPDGTGYRILHSFESNDGDGFPSVARLVQGADGALYGTTATGGRNGAGLVYRLNPDGTDYRVLHDFTGWPADGGYPQGSLIQGADGALYGTTLEGGIHIGGTVFRLNLDGTGYTILHAFTQSDGDGAWPKAGLVQGSDGAFYGITSGGGDLGLGTVFQIRPNQVPSIQCPASATLTCSPSGGFDVTVPVQISDPDGQGLTVSWSVDGTVQTVPAGNELTTATPTFAGVFTPGVHTVTFTVSDGLSSSTCETTITIEADITPPRLACATNLTVEFADEMGARVEFAAPTATDDCSGQVPVNCMPASGSLFPIGTTMVVCLAMDEAGNQAACSFTVTVLGARSLKASVLAELHALNATVRPRQAPQLAEAIGALRTSLSESLWVDETHLAADGGDLVFSADKEALQKLRFLLRTKRTHRADTALAGCIQRLAKADRLLAVVALQETKKETGRLRRLSLAPRALALGDQALAEGQYVAAVEHYRNAWNHTSTTSLLHQPEI